MFQDLTPSLLHGSIDLHVTQGAHIMLAMVVDAAIVDLGNWGAGEKI